MANPNDLFFQQKETIKNIQLKNDLQEEKSQCILIRFDICRFHFAVNLKFVQEIIEAINIVPYPEIFPHHVGIINLRGKTLPVIEFCRNDMSKEMTNQKMIVLEFNNSQMFAVRTQKIQKYTFPNDLNLVSEQTLNLGAHPTTYLDEKYFDKFFKEKLC